MNILKNLEDKVNIMGKELVNFRVNTETVKKNQMKIWEQKITHLKKSLYGLCSRLYTHMQRLSDLYRDYTNESTERVENWEGK